MGYRQLFAGLSLALFLLGLPALGFGQSTNDVQFSYQIGSGASGVPCPAHYSINSQSPVTLTLSTDSATWVSASLSSNTASATVSPTLTITVSPTGLQAGTYHSTIQINSGALIFNVTLTVATAPLNLSSACFAFNAVAGGIAPASQTLTVTAQTSTSASVQVSQGTSCISWLTISPTGNFTASTSNTNFTISVNPSGLTAGTTCTGTISLSVGGVVTQSVGVTLNVTATSASGLTLSSSGLTFTGVSGGVTPASQTLTVTAQTSTNATTKVSPGTCNSTWLTLSPNGNFIASTSNTTYTVSVNQSGLTAGTTCTGTISMITVSGTESATIILNVTAPTASGLTLSSSAFTFNAAAGGTTPASQTLTVTAQTNTSATAQASQGTSCNSTWLTLSPTGSFIAGTSSTNFTISVNPSGIAGGTTCTGTISMSTTTGTETATVTLTVTGVTVTSLTVSTSTLTFNATAGGATPPSLPLTVTAPAYTNATIQITEQTCASINWLTVSPSGTFLAGPTITTLAVSVNQAGLSVNNVCTGTITISASSGTQTVTVTLTLISVPTSVLTVSPTSLTFNVPASGAAPASQTLGVTAYFDTNATAQLTEQSCANSNWLTLSPTGAFTATATATNFTVSVNPSGIAPGTTCTGAIVINPVSGVRMVPVTMVVAPLVSGPLTFSASALTFNAVIGSAGPPSQTLTVTAQNSATVTAQVSEQTCTNATWLTLTPTGSFTAGPSNANFTVSVDPSSFTTATTCTGTIAMVSSSGTQTLAVTMVVSAPTVIAPVVSASPTGLSFTYALGDPSPAPQVVAVSGGGAAALFSISTYSSGWLQVSPSCIITSPCATPNTGTLNLAVTVDPTGVNPGGPYFGTIVLSGIGLASGTTIVNVSLTVTAPSPVIALVTNAASFITGPVSPGEMISLFANPSTPIGPATAVSLSATTCPAPCTNVPTTIGGVQVIFQPGGVAAPITYASSTQVNCLVPYEILGGGSIQMQVKYLGQNSNAMTLQYAASQPGIFTATGTGTGLASVQQYDAQGNYQGQNSSSNPAKAGWYLTFYVTGEGMIPSPAVTGKVTSTAAVIPLLGPPNVLIDNLPSTVTYFAEANGFVSGIMQVNAIVPAGVRTGQSVPLALSMNGTNTQSGVVIYIN